MMLNPKISKSKKLQKKQGSPRSPLKLKNLNIASSSSSTTSCSSSLSSSTTISSEAQKGCLSFFLSHHSSVLSKNSNVGINTPKSAPKVRNFKGNVVKKACLDNVGTRLVKKNPNLLKSREKFRSKCENQIKLSDDCDNVGKVRKPSSRCGSFNGINKKASKFDVQFSDNAENLRKPGSRYEFSDGIGKKTSRVELKFNDNAVNLRKPGSRYDLSDGISEKLSKFKLKCSDNAANLRKPGSRYDIRDGMSEGSTGFDVDLSDGYEGFTPVNKVGSGSGLVGCSRNDKDVKLVDNDLKCGDASRSPTPPPVQISVSPEIQGGSTLVVAATPTTCYAAGHILSGVTDKRKCRPKGILTTIGNNKLFESSKSKGFNNQGGSVARGLSNRRDSIVPSPTEASVCWISSPRDEKKSKTLDDDTDDDTNELRLSQCEKLLPFSLVGCSSSLSSSLGFSSEMFNNSSCSISTSYASSATPSSRSRSSMLNSDLSSEFRGVLGPSLDHLVRCPSPPSPVAAPSFNVGVSPEQGTFRFDHERRNSPDLEDSLGSGNVMQTPESNSSPCSYVQPCQITNSTSRSPNFSLSDLGRDQISRSWYECELDSVAELLRGVKVTLDGQTPELDSSRPSFEFNPLTKLDSSADLTISQKAMDISSPDKCESLLHSLPDPGVKKLWREGSANCMSEIDELDCCRYLSDEEDNANECTVASESCSCL